MTIQLILDKINNFELQESNQLSNSSLNFESIYGREYIFYFKLEIIILEFWIIS